MLMLLEAFVDITERKKAENHKRELSERKEALRSEEIKLNLALRDLEELRTLEDEFLEKGKAENSEISKRTVAYKIKDLREKQKNLDGRIQIYNNRIKVLHQQISSLETLVEAGSGGLPDEKEIEAASFEAAQKLENLNNLLMKVESSRPEADREDDEVRARLREQARQRFCESRQGFDALDLPPAGRPAPLKSGGARQRREVRSRG